MWIERLKKIVENNGEQAFVVSTLPRVEARLILETRQWRTRPLTDASTAPELLATGISGVNLGDLALAEQASKALAILAEKAASEDSFYNRKAAPLAIMQKQVAGALLIAEGSTDQGLELLEESVNIAEQMPLPRGAANPIKPAHEFYGEALLAASRPSDAARQFSALLLRMPNRPLALLGLARSYVALGDEDAAGVSYSQLVDVWKSRNFPALDEAIVHLAATRAD